jgi:Tol biopolymer transport system component
VTLFALPASAAPRGQNGQIAFTRFEEPDTAIFVVNPDGTNEHQLTTTPPAALPNECPHWSPDGTRITTCGSSDGNGSTLVINPDTGAYRELPNPEPNVNTPCYLWSPDATRLACEGYGQADPNLNGIYSIRSSDGSGLTKILSTPNDGQELGGFSPTGKYLVFSLSDQDGNGLGLFTVESDGTGLKQITAVGTNLSSSGNWSPQGNEIILSRHVTPDVHSSLWVVHANGTGLHEIHIEGLACGGANSDPNGIGCSEPVWSPDGSKFAFKVSSANGSDIYTANADGSDLLQVTHDGDASGGPQWGTHPATG